MQMFKKGNYFCKIAVINLETIILYNIVTVNHSSEIGSLESLNQGLS